MNKILPLFTVLALFAIVPQHCMAMLDLAQVDQEKARKLELKITARAAGPDLVRIELEFPTKGELKHYSRVDLEMLEGGKLLLSSTLREEKSSPGDILVGFAVARSNLDKIPCG